ncbi:hypothetical protein FPSE_08110 [Fusarium pseudograminearum CS3096]|uniref:Uncharacterized protein n=1 Tax=Fusarium pseudograminearum (strain CS3096) TaxID=1028729 RepID=K3VD49_FUSPC|nr:hypothetical protein FPSE_08110 [Fusarium pseudograminearum CS3096]EKJ71664.1 hypothetical protein FPSE_08110 [Fusarium pseudograminearum CS3096]
MARHKLTPVLMTGSLLLGLTLAIGHHLFYDYLNDRIVQSQNQQEWFLRIGTGMAFLVRTLLSAAIGIAYVQIIWKTLKFKSVTVNGINSLFDALHNAWNLTTLELWTAAPTLTAVALVAWALPLIAVITPATLSIEISSEQNITVIDSLIPNIDYDNNIGFFGSWYQNNTVFPSSLISRLLLPVATLGYILNIPAPFPNSSYSIDFYGPSISCTIPENAAFIDRISQTIANFSRPWGNVTYVGFVPTAAIYPDSPPEVITREDYAIEGLRRALNYTLVYTAISLDPTDYVSNQGFFELKPASFYVTTPNRPGGSAEKTFKCELYNTSYTVNFTFDNGLQNIRYKTERLNGVTALLSNDCHSQRQSDGCNAVTAYLSLMSAIGDLLLGARWNSLDGVGASHRTPIASTVLLESSDMHMIDPNDRPKFAIKSMPMGETLEELFTNLTISLFSNYIFLQNDTTASYIPVTRFSAQNAFSYEPRNLFIAYVYGLLCIKSSSSSYTNSFSTILRTTRNPDLDTVISAAETSGAEPLSKTLGNVRLTLRRQGDCLEGGGDKATFFAVDSRGDDGKKAREAAPTESLLKQNGQSQHSDTDEISSTQEGSDVNLYHRKDNNANVASDN